MVNNVNKLILQLGGDHYENHYLGGLKLINGYSFCTP